MRVVVLGTSGSGKSTFARRLAAAAGIARIELDEINWRPGWYDRSRREPEAFIADVRAATAGDAWVCAGSYSKVRAITLARATVLVWLDLPRSVVMRQVILRSLGRMLGHEPFPGCREDVWRVLDPGHPIRWAWSTHARRRAQITALVEDPQYARLEVFRCRSRRDVEAALAALVARRPASRASAPAEAAALV